MIIRKIRLQLIKLDLNLPPINRLQRFTIQQHKKHPSRPVRRDIAPSMHSRALDQHIAPTHDPLLTTIQLNLELAFKYSPVVDRHRAVQGRFHARCEVDHAQECSAGDVQAGLESKH